MRILDLFSGIGGFSLGLNRAGMTTVAFCEIDPFCRRVLAKHWPGVPCYDDVRTLTADRLAADGIAVDVICGGFPCQDISLANQYAEGLEGRRSGLWFDMLRLTEEICPAWVIAENVSALRVRGLDSVLRGLASVGYDAEWHCIPAAAAGAPHERDRVWIVAHPNRARSRKPSETKAWGECVTRRDAPDMGCDTAVLSGRTWRGQPREWQAEPNVGRLVDGFPRRVDRRGRLTTLGNAVVPQIPELIGRAILASERAPA